jgi:single-strand DNA-binding protein
MFSKIVIVGHLGTDPEGRTTANGLELAKLRVAVKGRGKDADTVWWNVTAWRKSAEYCTKYLKKGELVLVEGRVNVREYTNKEGVQVKSYEIDSDHIQGFGKRNKNEEQTSRTSFNREFEEAVPF